MGKLGAGHTIETLNNYVKVGSMIVLCDALVRFTTSLLPTSFFSRMNIGGGS
jgi:hypothetical protein